MTAQKFLSIGFIPAIGILLFILGAFLGASWLVILGIILAGVAAIVTTVVAALAKSKSVILTTIGSVATAAGCASWFLLPESSINIGGLVTMALGSVILVVSTSLAIVEE